MAPSGSEPALEIALRDVAWVGALSRRLARDGEAEDLAQDTWVAALEAPGRARDGLRQWLSGVARFLAVRRRRRALDEPYRATVLLRYYEGLALEDVARRTGVPGSTARTRLSRAHESLRARLDLEFGGREVWSLLTLPGAKLGTASFVVRSRSTGPRPTPEPGCTSRSRTSTAVSGRTATSPCATPGTRIRAARSFRPAATLARAPDAGLAGETDFTFGPLDEPAPELQLELR